MARRLNLIIPALLLLLGLALRATDPPVLADLRLKVFDYYQALKPRTFDPTLPVRIIDIDDDTVRINTSRSFSEERIFIRFFSFSSL